MSAGTSLTEVFICVVFRQVSDCPGGVDALTAVGFVTEFEDADQSMELLSLQPHVPQEKLEQALRALDPEAHLAPTEASSGAPAGLEQLESAVLGQSGVPLVSLPPTQILDSLAGGMTDASYFAVWAHHHLGAVIKQVRSSGWLLAHSSPSTPQQQCSADQLIGFVWTAGDRTERATELGADRRPMEGGCRAVCSLPPLCVASVYT